MTPRRAGPWLKAAAPALTHLLSGVSAHAVTEACLPSARSVVAAAVVTVVVIRALEVAAPQARPAGPAGPGATAGRAVVVQAFVHAVLALSARCTSGHGAGAMEVGGLPSWLMIGAHLVAVGATVVLLTHVDATLSRAAEGLLSLLSRARQLLLPTPPTARCGTLPDLRQCPPGSPRRCGDSLLSGSTWSRRGPPAALPA
jgi:hypothetical protein